MPHTQRVRPIRCGESESSGRVGHVGCQLSIATEDGHRGRLHRPALGVRHPAADLLRPRPIGEHRRRQRHYI